MVEGAVVERGVLTASGPVWEAAARRAEVIGRLAARPRVGLAVAEEAAVVLGVSRRQVYVLVGRWRAGEGVVSDLLPGRSGGGRGAGRLPEEVEAIVREVLRSRYLTRQRRSVERFSKQRTRRVILSGIDQQDSGTRRHACCLRSVAIRE